MFTGIIQQIGILKEIEYHPLGATFDIEASLPEDFKLGQSIAVNGVCLSASSISPTYFSADLSPETLRRTAMQSYEKGRALNLELPLKPDSFLGGHFVQGHVDGVGHLEAIEQDGDFLRFALSYPSVLRPMMIEKGSICVDGVSLTINRVTSNDVLELMLIPQTLRHTNLSSAKVGQLINLEADMIGKFVVRYLHLSHERWIVGSS